MFAVVLATLVFAQETLESITLDATLVTFIVSLFIPLAVGLITKSTASTTIKQIVLIVLNAINALVTTAVVGDGSAIITKEAATLFVLSLGISIASYLGIYKPQDANEKLASTKGLG